ncbi:MAG: uroporphyrinogen-III C-methyltransferase [Arenimonas sp.]
MSLPVSDSPTALPSRRLPGALWALLAIAALLAALFGWKTWSVRPVRESPTVDLSNEALDERLLQVESTLENSRRTQEAQEQRQVDTRARTGLLRDEVLALTQRASLIEDSVRDAAAGSRDGVAALRLDEAELLLTIAQQRLELSGDLAGTIRATELAEGVLSTQRDPALLDLRQTLAQELAALRALPASPRAAAAGELDALEAMLPRLAATDALGAGRARAPGEPVGGVQRLLDSLVQVRRSGGQDLLSPADREAGGAALGLELALARRALADGDQTAFQRAIPRIDAWLLRLYPDGAALGERRARLAKLRQLELRYSLPIAGASLKQLQALQHERRSGR